ncbi:hypothetical protein [Curtobacterium sp. MCBA15_001]|uniref:hypothetical protein n=1 Tax=Curtobacterium sp. MCBA15_001 TaxID=1898731 RepID=UPI0008DE800F|nr:hypothetical protein [Curtobacterium sp. MCBA15_001]OIH95910.1 hypothetical protein BIU90_17675 [Curtobacterium sp. MCBA15_001]
MHRIITTTLAALVLGGACVGLGATSASAASLDAPWIVDVQTSDGRNHAISDGGVTLPTGVDATVMVSATDRAIVAVVDEHGKTLCEDAGRTNPYICTISAAELPAGDHTLTAKVRLGNVGGPTGTSKALPLHVVDGAESGTLPGPNPAVDPVTGTSASASAAGAPRTEDDPATGLPIGSGGAEGAESIAKPTVTEGERIGKQLSIDVVVPEGAAWELRIFDARGETAASKTVVGTGQAEHFLVDAPYGKTRTFSVQLWKGSERVSASIVSALGGPKI